MNMETRFGNDVDNYYYNMKIVLKNLNY